MHLAAERLVDVARLRLIDGQPFHTIAAAVSASPDDVERAIDGLMAREIARRRLADTASAARADLRPPPAPSRRIGRPRNATLHRA